VRSRRAIGAVVLALVAGVGGCGGATGGDRAPAPGAVGTVTVLAASSLTESFTALGQAFEAAHPGSKVTFNFAGSTALARQLAEGAPGDVLATADQASMQAAVDDGSVAAPLVFARNRLEIAVAKGNPEAVGGLADLARPGLVVVLCAPEVPCGKLAAEALRRAGVDVRPASLEENAKAVVSRLTLGEADAGIVYVTDVRAAGTALQGVPIPDQSNVVAAYPIARAARSANPVGAQAWIDLVLSPEGQRTLGGFGFAAAAVP
jgi:molybdate transport system substrate-binding protein